jgi:hypothetical protein
LLTNKKHPKPGLIKGKMKRRIYTIRSETVIDNLTAFLKSQPEKPLLEVIVQEKKKDRTAEQNGLLWFWITIIAKERGSTKEDVHDDLKERLLVPIYERDEPGFAEMMVSIRKVYTQGFKQDALKMHKHIVKLTSTTSADTKQFAEYLREIEKDQAEKGLILPRKEDQYNYAMGIKQ